jgi:hypothetical protein
MKAGRRRLSRSGPKGLRVRRLAGRQRAEAAFFRPLVEQIAAQRAEVRQQPPAGDEVLTQALQLVVREPQRVQVAGVP